MTTDEAEAIIRKAQVLRLAMAGEDGPYMVPVCFGYEDGALFVHCGPHGKKVDMLRKDPRVCFEVDVDVQIAPKDSPCKWTFNYRSVIGFGRASFVEDRDAKVAALAAIVRQYGSENTDFSEKSIDATTIVRIDIESMTARQSGYGE